MQRTAFLWLCITSHAAALQTRRTAVTRSPLRAAAVEHAVAEATLADGGRAVDVAFADGSWRFHALWLRDACRDADHVVAAAGERILTSTPVGPADEMCSPETLRAAACRQEDGVLVVEWSEGATEASRFAVDELRGFAPTVGLPLDAAAGAARPASADPAWLRPYTGYPDASGAFGRYVAFAGDAGADHRDEAASGEFPWRVAYEEIAASSCVKLEYVKRVLVEGAALVTGVPDEESGVSLRRFVDDVLGGLQKEPTRDEPNWRIVRRPDAASVSYNPSKRLYQHTDSSVPPHGIPALMLSMHYVEGTGVNTLTDGYAVAEKLRALDPEAFELLATYGYDGSRDFAGSRSDSIQDHKAGLVIDRKHPVFVTDAEGELLRVQYNEVFRTPLTLPYDVFPKWYAAFSKFVELVHSPEFERSVPMQQGNLLVMNNWRTLHGRAGGQASANRHVVGGTILREAVYSRARSLLDEVRRAE